MEFPERDRKELRRVHGLAVDRYCARLLNDLRLLIHDPSVTAHERYLQATRLLRERTREMAHAFDDMRRSTAMHRFAAIVALDVLTPEELEHFSPRVRSMAEAWNAALSDAGMTASISRSGLTIVEPDGRRYPPGIRFLERATQSLCGSVSSRCDRGDARPGCGGILPGFGCRQ